MYESLDTKACLDYVVFRTKNGAHSSKRLKSLCKYMRRNPDVLVKFGCTPDYNQFKNLSEYADAHWHLVREEPGIGTGKYATLALERMHDILSDCYGLQRQMEEIKNYVEENKAVARTSVGSKFHISPYNLTWVGRQLKKKGISQGTAYKVRVFHSSKASSSDKEMAARKEQMIASSDSESFEGPQQLEITTKT